MDHIDRGKYEELINNKPTCFNNSNTEQTIISDIDVILDESKKLIQEKNIQYAGTWLLERDLWLQSEKNTLDKYTESLSRGRIVLVNPGSDNMGREQRYVHPYIVLGEYQETFIGVPITNMAKNKKTGEYYLRHFFEVELINPKGKKPFTEYRCSKPSVADIRNIAGLDKRRIIQDQLFTDKKFVPSTYLDSISKKINSTIALQTEKDS